MKSLHRRVVSLHIFAWSFFRGNRFRSIFECLVAWIFFCEFQNDIRDCQFKCVDEDELLIKRKLPAGWYTLVLVWRKIKVRVRLDFLLSNIFGSPTQGLAAWVLDLHVDPSRKLLSCTLFLISVENGIISKKHSPSSNNRTPTNLSKKTFESGDGYKIGFARSSMRYCTSMRVTDLEFCRS